jgi:hypothetical protein
MGERITVNATSVDKYEKLREIVNKTHKDNPNSEDLTELRRLFDEDPELWRTSGNMARRTLDHLLHTYYSQSAYVRECVRRRVKELREQLGYGESPPLERILIEQVLVCWVNLYVLEMNSATKLRESHSTETGLYWDRRLTGAQRRFRRASESLARIRKFSRNTPALLLNIAANGGQQVNLTK